MWSFLSKLLLIELITASMRLYFIFYSHKKNSMTIGLSIPSHICIQIYPAQLSNTHQQRKYYTKTDNIVIKSVVKKISIANERRKHET